MKKFLEILRNLIALLVIVFLLFVIEETLRIKSDTNAKPLVVLRQETYVKTEGVTKAGTYENDYVGIGYTLRMHYSEENNTFLGEEVMLFNKLKLYEWKIQGSY